MTVLAGVLSPIENLLTNILEWLHSSGGLTWAWAIVVITAMVRLVIVPLTIKQVRSMQRLQQHAPELKALQQKYKHDKQRMNEEVMKFYRENKVNPAASCLPIIPQIPIFIALFFVLRDFEREVFPQYPESSLDFLNGVVPNITTEINDHWSGWFLLVIYGLSQTLSMFLSMTSVQSKLQRYLFMALPIVFIPVIISFPVGLLIYWVTTNVWTIGQGIVVRRLIPRPALEPPKRTSRTAPKQRPDDGKTAQKPRPAGAARQPKAAAATQGDGASPKPRPVRRRKKKGPRSRR
jgi:YidC/Oxa1 family membrane protein insertase